MNNNQKPRIGVALSGGQLKAAAHIGVLEALDKVGIEPDVLAGTSAGSLVTTLYAHGYRTDDFRGLIENFPGLQLFDYGFPLWSSLYSWSLRHLRIRPSDVPYAPSGILRGRKLVSYVERLIRNRKPQKPFYIVATDLITGRPVVFTSEPEPIHRASDAYVELNDIPKAVAGSCALPGIFTPVRVDDFLLVDGAMRHYVPVSVLDHAGCDKIIAINLYRLPINYEPTTLVDVLARSFDILLRESIDNDVIASKKTYLLEPDFSDIKWRNFSQMRTCVDLGKRTVDDRRTELLAFMRNAH